MVKKKTVTILDGWRWLPPWRPRRLTPQEWTAFEAMGRILETHAWTFAKTMPQNPHHYTLRKHWHDPEEPWFFVVDQIRRYGYFQQYAGLWYVSHDVHDQFYWVMGGATMPIATYGRERALSWPGTFIINRKPLTKDPGYVVPYDTLAPVYAALFHDEIGPVLMPEHEQVFEAIGDTAGLDVLDVGCGTGVSLDYLTDIGSYLGVDPSQQMMAHLLARYPGVPTICCRFGAFVPPPTQHGYDLILALFGTGSYLTLEELARIPLLLRPGGLAAVMFYQPEAQPPIYQVSGIRVVHRPWMAGLFPGDAQEVGDGVLCLYRKAGL